MFVFSLNRPKTGWFFVLKKIYSFYEIGNTIKKQTRT